MTKNEFIQRTMIALAGNPAFADAASSKIKAAAIIREAGHLADEADNMSHPEFDFDAEHDNNMEMKGVFINTIGDIIDILGEIKEVLNDIRKGTDCIGDE